MAVAVLGILVAPHARQVSAAAPLPAQATAAVSIVTVADDMPCCPDVPPASECAKHCPLMALCATQLLAGSTAVALVISMTLLPRPAPLSDAPLQGLGDHPPAKPPRLFA